MISDKLRSKYLNIRWEFADYAQKWQRKLRPDSYQPPKTPISPGLERCKDVTVILLVMDPSHLLDRCLESLENQTLKPVKTEMIRNVSPAPKAMQIGLDRVETEYFVPVDEDMVLYPRCIEQLHYLISKTPKRGKVTLHLEDPIMGVIRGVHIYRTSAARPIGYYPMDDDKEYAKRLTRRLEEEGWECPAHKNFRGEKVIGGVHHPVYLPHEAYWKFHFVGEQERYYSFERWNWDNQYPRLYYFVEKITAYWQRTGDKNAIYALAGLMDGAFHSTDISKLNSYEGRLEDPQFQRVHEYLQNFKDMDRKPVKKGLWKWASFFK